MNQLAKKMTWVLERLAGATFCGLFLVTVFNITLRNLGGVTWLWIPGMSRLLFIWTVFLGTAVLYERDDHLIMDFFVNKMGVPKRAKLDLIINSIFLVFLVLLIIYGLMVVRVRMNISFETWKFPTAYAFLAAPVSGTLMIFFCINKLRKLLKRRRDE
jgi:TRAP-type C4-dicarboxylate transport system permease small subunit